MHCFVLLVCLILRTSSVCTQIYMKQVEECKILCRANYSRTEMEAWIEKIDEDYKVNWIVDNIPAATKYYFETEDPQPTGKQSVCLDPSLT